MKGFAGLAPINLIPISFFFFFWKIRGLLFSVYWTFFPGGLASYNFFFFFFQILVQNFFGLFFYLIVFLILTRVFLFFFKG